MSTPELPQNYKKASLGFLTFLLYSLGISVAIFAIYNIPKRVQKVDAIRSCDKLERQVQAARLKLEKLKMRADALDQSAFFRAEQMRKSLGFGSKAHRLDSLK